MSFCIQSSAGSAIFVVPEVQAFMKGERRNSESERENSEMNPGRGGEASECDWLGEGGESGGLSGKLMRSRRDLHWLMSLEFLRQEDPVFIIFSRGGVRSW